MSAMPSTVRSPGRSYSSKTTPRARSSLTVASMSSTSQPSWVWSPEAARPTRTPELAAALEHVEQAALALLDRLEAELLRVEAPRPPQVLRGQSRRDLAVLQHLIRPFARCV